MKKKAHKKLPSNKAPIAAPKEEGVQLYKSHLRKHPFMYSSTIPQTQQVGMWTDRKADRPRTSLPIKHPLQQKQCEKSALQPRPLFLLSKPSNPQKNKFNQKHFITKRSRQNFLPFQQNQFPASPIPRRQIHTPRPVNQAIKHSQTQWKPNMKTIGISKKKRRSRVNEIKRWSDV